jgi:hypothetical protein
MSNANTNREQNQLIELTATQQNPGAAKPTDFQVGGETPLPGHGQCGENEHEYNALLAEADIGKPRNGPAPERNQVPARRISDE